MSIGTICFTVCFTVKVTPPTHGAVGGTQVVCSWSVQQMGCVLHKTNLIPLTNSETNLIALHEKEKGVQMEENNEGFGIAFVTILFIAFILPSIVLLSVGDTWDRFIDKYGSAVTTECWENSKHEKVCRSDKKCKFGRLFCIEEGFRWQAD